MNKLKILNTITFISIASFLYFSSTNSLLASNKVDISKINLQLSNLNYENLGIIIWDQRPQTINQKHPESILGYRRSITGIAYPQFTKSEEALSKILLSKIKVAYNSSSIRILDTYSTDNENNIKQMISN